ncbi:hypothetical protein LSAT2_010724, partial [Lamellibrachia satsuma]
SRNMLHDQQNMLHAQWNTLHDQRNTLHDQRNTLHDQRNTLHDQRNMVHDQQNMVHDQQNMFHAQRNISQHQRTMSSNQRTMSSDQRTMSSDQRTMLPAQLMLGNHCFLRHVIISNVFHIDECAQLYVADIDECTQLYVADIDECTQLYVADIDECTQLYVADIDECTEYLPCEQNCTNTVGSFLCSCFAGFNYDQQTSLCTDIDECTRGLCGGTLPDILCLNTYGSYHCFGVNFGLFAADTDQPSSGGVVARAPETDTITGRRPLIYGLLAGMFVCLAVGILTLAVRLARRPSVRPATPSCTDPESLLADSTVTTPSTSRSAADITITSL